MAANDPAYANPAKSERICVIQAMRLDPLRLEAGLRERLTGGLVGNSTSTTNGHVLNIYIDEYCGNSLEAVFADSTRGWKPYRFFIGTVPSSGIRRGVGYPRAAPFARHQPYFNNVNITTLEPPIGSFAVTTASFTISPASLVVTEDVYGRPLPATGGVCTTCGDGRGEVARCSAVRPRQAVLRRCKLA